MRKLTEADINKVKLLYAGNEIDCNNAYYVGVKKKINDYHTEITLISSKGVYPIKFNTSINFLNFKVIYTDKCGLYIATKHDVFNTGLKELCYFDSCDKLILIKTHKKKQYVMNDKGKMLNLSGMHRYSSIKKVSDNRYALISVMSSRKECSIDIVDYNINFISKGVKADIEDR